MAYHDSLSHAMALHQHFADQLGESTSVLRGLLPENLGQSSSDTIAGAGKEQKDMRGLVIETAGKPLAQQHQVGGGPTWLNSAILRQQSQYGGDGSFLHLQTNSDSPNSAASNQWLHRSILQRNASSDVVAGSDVPVSSDSMIAAIALLPDSGHFRCKAEILAHPLYEQLLSAHVSCLRVATPVDQLPRIDAQLERSQQVVSKYAMLGQNSQPPVGDDSKELDQFMNHYVLLLYSFKDQLQQHVRVHAMEAVMACWELEQSVQSLTGVSPGEGTGATMSDDDDDDQGDSDMNLYDGSLESTEGMGFGPLVPTESERSLIERVRQELKHELKQGYKEKIVDIREEILRKRRAGKLPGDTTSLLKAWWQSHAKWPYPTEEDKARLVQETGLQLKQINNWFINQRKRNWHSNSSSSSALKSKRKR